MHYFISAGEASGDLHASQLMKQIKNLDPEARFTFLGGDLMAAEAGTTPVVHYREMAYMGFIDVLRNIGKVLGNLKKGKKAMTDDKPDCLILVDYPSFNLRLAEYANSMGVAVYYYISPKVWAWKEHRVKKIRRLVRKMLCILPFEEEYYRTRHGYEVTYVGNPSLNEVDRHLASMPGRKDFLKANSLPDKKLLALLPGSRKGEIEKNLNIMLEAAGEFEDCLPVVAASPGIDEAFYDTIAPGVARVVGQTLTLVAYSEGAFVTSGTATLETAIAGTPQAVAYRSVGLKPVYDFFKKILKVKFVSLPNLIANREIVPELLLHECTPRNLASALKKMLSQREVVEQNYSELRNILTQKDASTEAAKEIVDDLRSLQK